ncbi:STN domain-containing protein [Chryseobacterium polytrichastri]|nr:STN domain-containing protein [Chryseobacterium polytrichastri]
MRLQFFLFIMLFTSLLAAATNLRAQNVTIEAKAVPMYQVFKQIEKQTGFLFWYKGKMLGKSTPITISITNMPLKAALDKIFSDIPFSYEIVGETIVVKEKTAVKEKAKEKQSRKTVTGIVTDEKGEPLAGVGIKLKGINIAASTDSKGVFSIDVPDQDAVLQFSYVGYETYEQTVSESTTLVIKLKENPNQLEGIEVVSTGYQRIPKERATGSFAAVNNELLNRRVSPNIIDRLEGTVPGLMFNRNTAASSSGTDINIRGHSTLFANDQPLIIVDNFPYDGDISNINPNDVESITVLKDAAAASIWGG